MIFVKDNIIVSKVLEQLDAAVPTAYTNVCYI